MNGFDVFKTETASRRHAGSRTTGSRFSTAINRSEPARAAVEFALAAARARGSELRLLHIVGDRTDLAQRLESGDGVPLRHRIISGDPTASLIEASGRAAAIVIGRYRHGVRSGSLLRPTAAQLTQHALCPIFLVG
jgi:nucleotide-binding universal stress UspA family protein